MKPDSRVNIGEKGPISPFQTVLPFSNLRQLLICSFVFNFRRKQSCDFYNTPLKLHKFPSL